MGEDGGGGVRVGVDDAGAEELVVDVEGELRAGGGSGFVEKGVRGEEVLVIPKPCDLGRILPVRTILLDRGETAATELTLELDELLVVLVVAVGEGVDEGRVCAEAGADDSSEVRSRGLCCEVLCSLLNESGAEWLELLVNLTSLLRDRGRLVEQRVGEK